MVQKWSKNHCNLLQYLPYLYFQTEENIKTTEKQALAISCQLQ